MERRRRTEAAGHLRRRAWQGRRSASGHPLPGVRGKDAARRPVALSPACVATAPHGSRLPLARGPRLGAGRDRGPNVVAAARFDAGFTWNRADTGIRQRTSACDPSMAADVRFRRLRRVPRGTELPSGSGPGRAAQTAGTAVLSGVGVAWTPTGLGRDSSPRAIGWGMGNGPAFASHGTQGWRARPRVSVGRVVDARRTVPRETGPPPVHISSAWRTLEGAPHPRRWRHVDLGPRPARLPATAGAQQQDP